MIPDFKSSRRDVLEDFDGAGESIAGLYGYPRSISSLPNSLAPLHIKKAYQNNFPSRKGPERQLGCTSSIYIVQRAIRDYNRHHHQYFEQQLH